MKGGYTNIRVIVKKFLIFLVFIIILFNGFSSIYANSLRKQSISMLKKNYSNYISNSNENINNIKNNETWDFIVPDDFPSIQEAIDNAFPYARIYVRSGVYNEQIIINVHALHIVGEDLHSTVILGKESETLVEIRSFLVTITGFNISSGNIGLRFNGLSTTFNTISGNTFFKNNIGIQIGDIERSTLIYHNNFFQNNLHAIDQYENSMWYDSDIKQGNFWDDYTGIDSNGDGIGDTPYEIPGNHTKDYYPLILPYCGNCSPYQPSKPIGILKGYINNNYNYSSFALDPRELDLFYWFEWGDGNNSGWIGPIRSGLSCNASHSWMQKGNYEIRVRVKNSVGTLSLWSDSLTVYMPKYMISDIANRDKKNSIFSFFDKIFDFIKMRGMEI
jgi:hypothetical protein